jgi:hypothetical protein
VDTRVSRPSGLAEKPLRPTGFSHLTFPTCFSLLPGCRFPSVRARRPQLPASCRVPGAWGCTPSRRRLTAHRSLASAAIPARCLRAPVPQRPRPGSSSSRAPFSRGVPGVPSPLHAGPGVSSIFCRRGYTGVDTESRRRGSEGSFSVSSLDPTTLGVNACREAQVGSLAVEGNILANGNPRLAMESHLLRVNRLHAMGAGTNECSAVSEVHDATVTCVENVVTPAKNSGNDCTHRKGNQTPPLRW